MRVTIKPIQPYARWSIEVDAFLNLITIKRTKWNLTFTSVTIEVSDHQAAKIRILQDNFTRWTFSYEAP